jgi:hypothetical protein
MLTIDERNQVIKFQDAIGKILDQYLKEGMDPDIIREVLRDEAGSSLETRRYDLEHQT